MVYKDLEKQRQTAAKWRAANPEKLREYGRRKHKKHYPKNREKILARCKEYRERNREKIKAYFEKYREQNREKCIAATRKWNRIHRDELIARDRQKTLDNPNRYKELYAARREHFRAKDNGYRERNKEKMRKWFVAYYKKNREKIRLYNQQYERKYAAKRGLRRTKAIKESSGEDLEFVKSFYAFVRNAPEIMCYWCGRKVQKGKRIVDHYIPICRGGKHHVANLVASCRKCNNMKLGKLPHEFIKWLDEVGERSSPATTATTRRASR